MRHSTHATPCYLAHKQCSFQDALGMQRCCYAQCILTTSEVMHGWDMGNLRCRCGAYNRSTTIRTNSRGLCTIATQNITAEQNQGRSNRQHNHDSMNSCLGLRLQNTLSVQADATPCAVVQALQVHDAASNWSVPPEHTQHNKQTSKHPSPHVITWSMSEDYGTK